MSPPQRSNLYKHYFTLTLWSILLFKDIILKFVDIAYHAIKLFLNIVNTYHPNIFTFLSHTPRISLSNTHHIFCTTSKTNTPTHLIHTVNVLYKRHHTYTNGRHSAPSMSFMCKKVSFIHARLIFIELTGLSVLYPHV